MPKHMSLAMTVRHLSGSVQLIGLLDGFGYSVSTSVVINHDTAVLYIANQEMCRGDNALTSAIQPGNHTILIYDNNDFGGNSDTVTGRGTTHNTNGIAVQCSSRLGEERPQQVDKPSVKRTRERSVLHPTVDIVKYYGGRKGPKEFDAAMSLQASTYASLLEASYVRRRI